jgi:hypothetical protein
LVVGDDGDLYRTGIVGNRHCRFIVHEEMIMPLEKLSKKQVLANIPALVDLLGQRKAILAQAKAEVDEVVDILKAMSPTAEVLIEEERHVPYIGDLFEALIYAQEKTSTDWAKVCEKAKVPTRIVKRYTTKTPTLCCRVAARKMPNGRFSHGS